MKVAIGFFDGVHAGHRRILQGADAALTFRNHPLAVLAPERAPRLIQPFKERVESIRECGVGEVVSLRFTQKFAGMDRLEFVKRVLTPLAGGGRLSVRCGGNWRFGRGGAGDAEFLRSVGIDVEVVPFALYGGEAVSSSRIRMAIEAGRLVEANAMLTRAWTLEGTVLHGKGLGRKIGFPTLNIHPSALELRLPCGAYAVDLGGVRGVANWGVAPTAGDGAWKEPVLEVHLLGAIGRFPRARSRVKVKMLSFLRPEIKFPSMDALAGRIKLDIAQAVAIASDAFPLR